VTGAVPAGTAPAAAHREQESRFNSNGFEFNRRNFRFLLLDIIDS
jgi:hypothetical protein